ncbi:hypothetical protein NicSoilC5_26550 [Arthrobacter sp. NicSoilC5]|nr:hypothetical protein NicSoilC5_26550 [Arthrobacter sp. NicSoilC5]
MLVSSTEVSPREPGMAATTPDGLLDLTRSTLDGTTAPQGKAAVHCGSPMQLVTPALGWERASYTFAPTSAGSTELPPVWRCACGFQLDAWTTDSRGAHHTAAFPA